MKSVWITLTALITSVTTSALAAGGAPHELFNRSVKVTYSILTPTMESNGHDLPSSQTREFYVSSQGRLFARSIRQAVGATKIQDTAPGGSWHFEGGKVVAVQPALSGVFRLEVTFDGGFKSCTANVILGQLKGAGYSWNGPDGHRWTLAGKPSVSNMSCTIQDGNIFSG